MQELPLKTQKKKCLTSLIIKNKLRKICTNKSCIFDINLVSAVSR